MTSSTRTPPVLAGVLLALLLVVAGDIAALVVRPETGSAFAVPRGAALAAQQEQRFVPARVLPVAAAFTGLRRDPCPHSPGIPATSATVARAVSSKVRLFTGPDDKASSRVLSNPTAEGETLVMLAHEQRGSWTLVQVPERPNETTGWVHETDLAQTLVPYRVVVELCRRRLTVYGLGQKVFRTTVAIGAPATPTPQGHFYIDYITSQYAGGSYGPWLLSLAGFSNVLQDFGGGRGQIALHGTNHPRLIGQAVSHGCVRLRNEDIVRLHELLEPGTPVIISA